MLLVPTNLNWFFTLFIFCIILVFFTFLTSFFIYYLVNITYAFFAPKHWIEANSNYLIVNPICLYMKHDPYKLENSNTVQSAFLTIHRKPQNVLQYIEQTELILSIQDINGGEYNLSWQPNSISCINLFVRDYKIKMSRLILVWSIYLAELSNEYRGVDIRITPFMPERVYDEYNQKYGHMIQE